MAIRDEVFESVRGVARVILSLRRLGGGSVGGNAGGFRTRKVEWSRTGVDLKILARIERQKNLGILFNRTTQIR